MGFFRIFQMSKTIIFLAGFCVPLSLSKTKFVWNERFWDDYKCVFLSSKTPRSDKGIKEELSRLKKIISSYDQPTLAGHSLGAWWTAHLMMEPDINIKNAVYLTPLSDLKEYPKIFKSSQDFDIFSRKVPQNRVGPHKNLIIYGNIDLITPRRHASMLAKHFNGFEYKLSGGHLIQTNHDNALIFMKEWVEL